MKTKKQHLLMGAILLLFLGFQSCAQDKTKKKPETSQAKKGMLFTLKFENQNCTYEILVNDVPAATYFGLGEGFSLSKEINQYILKPVKQEITIRMYPQKRTEISFDTVLSKTAKVKISIKKSQEPLSIADIAVARDKGIPTEWQIFTFETPKIETNLPYTEYKTSFDVNAKDITWKITGWSESKYLINEPDLRKQTDAFYQNFATVLATKNQQQYLDLLKTSIHEEALSKPWFGADFEKDLSNEISKNANQERTFIYPCKNAELKFYGNGKIVTLVCKDMSTFGYSPLLSETAGNALPKAHTIYLHKPKGSDKLEIIR